ncbi:MAG: hypothetical protein R6X02_28260 [Enhygromyxa sp.]
MLGSWSGLVGQLDEQLAPARVEERKQQLGRLDRRAWIFYAADFSAEEINSNTAKKERRELARAVTEHDRFLFKWALPIFGDDPEYAQTLADISRGTGARDDAEDVLCLVAMFRENWAQVEGQTMVTKERIDQAVADATTQLDLLRNGQVNPARKLADAAYSAWYHDYNELMQLGRYLGRGEPDLTERFPGVREMFTRSSSSARDQQDSAGEEQDADAEQQPEVDAGA